MYFIKTDDGIPIAVNDINPTGKAAVLFIHGWPLNGDMFEYQMNTLPHLGFRCITMDLRGFGNSDCPAQGYDYDRLAKDVRCVIDSIGAKNLTLAGFSMGGAIALRYAAKYKGWGIEKLALLAAAAPMFTQRPDYPHGMPTEDVNKLIELAQKDRPQMVLDFGGNVFAQKHSASFMEWFKQIGWSASSIGTIETAKSLRDEDLRADLEGVTLPTGIFHGKLDQVCPYQFAMMQHEQIKGSTLYTFKKSGHAVFYEELDLFNEKFCDFLGKDTESLYKQKERKLCASPQGNVARHK